MTIHLHQIIAEHPYHIMEKIVAIPAASALMAPSYRVLNYHFLHSLKRDLKKFRGSNTQILCHSVTGSQLSVGRREATWHAATILLALTCNFQVAKAIETELQEEYIFYKDEKAKFSLLIPRDWVKGEGQVDGDRSVTAFSPENETIPNLSIVTTGVGADYTRMESFGTVDAFAETLVNSQDKSWQRPPGQEAKLLDAKSRNGVYLVEYTIRKPGEKKIHLISAVGLGFDVWYNKLYIVTGQYLDEDGDKYKSKIEQSVLSFRIA